MPKKHIIPDQAAYAKRYGKLDTERLGLFIEMPYFSEKSSRKVTKIGGLLSMLPGGPKTKCGNMDGYFESEYKRVFAADKGNKKDKFASKLVSRGPFIPPGYPKRHSCPGDYFGCFSGTITAVSRRLRKEKKAPPAKPNPLTSPAKKGGPGYPHICLNKYPEYKPQKLRKEKKPLPTGKAPMIPFTYPREYFEPNIFQDRKQATKRLYIRPKEKRIEARALFVPTGPAKWLGGCKAGCFDNWPEWRDAKSFKKKKEYKPKFVQRGQPFVPQSYSEKTMYNRPTLFNTDFHVNATNWRTAGPKFVEYLVENVNVRK